MHSPRQHLRICIEKCMEPLNVFFDDFDIKEVLENLIMFY